MVEADPTFDHAGRLRLDGRVALVTGAGAGIGRATVHALAQAGALVAVTDIEPEAARRTAAEVDQARAYALDVAAEGQVQATVAAVALDFGRLDILVNNAGLGARLPTVELPLARWERALAVGATGSYLCAREAGRHMLQAGSGAVVNVASIMGLVGGRHYANLAYHAAKGAVVNMTRALALEWAAHGIRVNAVAPTFVRTRLVEPLLAEPGMEQRLLADTPMGRLATPEEVAGAILFLCSDMASMITGVVLPVDGGWLAQ